MKYFSVCSGIEAASVAWHPLGWDPVGFSEIEAFPSAVLAHRFPAVKNYGDMTKFKEWENVGKFDVLVGGTPCQSFSVAGLRKGLTDPRGNLMLVYGAMADYFKPSWIVWENVPGVLSSNGGKDFGTFLGMLGELGYGFAYRVLDAQYYGVAQKRRRVFVVGYLGDWRPPAKVLFESESLCGNTPPSRETRKDATELAGTLAANGGGTNRPAGNCNELDFCVTAAQSQYGNEVAGTLTRRFDSSPCADRGQNIIMSTGQGNAEISVGLRPTLNCNHEAPILATDSTPAIGDIRLDEISSCISKNTGAGGETQNPAFVQKGSTVRRLTPRECERLQGFPDDWTKIPWRGAKAEDCPDGPRYKACGNSMAVPVMNWIGKRINAL